MSSLESPITLRLPDLVSLCPFPLRINPQCEACSSGTDEWISSFAGLSSKRRHAVTGLKAGTLASMAYPDGDLSELRVCSDFLHWLFHLDDLTDDMGIKDATEVSKIVMDVLYHPENYQESIEQGRAPALVRLTYDIWKRVLVTATVRVRERFRSSIEGFLQAIHTQSVLRSDRTISDMDSYIMLRRDDGGVWPAFVLLEYAAVIELRDEVLDHPVMRQLKDNANDLICCANDLYSFNKEQARGDLNNLVVIIMQERGITMQESFDFIGQLFQDTVQNFTANISKLPSWGVETDNDVVIYVHGLANWVVGNVHWSFASQRYFFDKGAEVKQSRVLELLPRRQQLAT